MAECHGGGKKHTAGALEVYAGGFRKNAHSPNGSNGNVDYHQSNPKNNPLTHNSVPLNGETLRREVNGGLYIGERKGSGSTDNLNPKFSANNNSPAISSGSMHHSEDSVRKSSNSGNSFCGEDSRKARQSTLENSLQVGYSSGNTAGLKSTKAAEGSSSTLRSTTAKGSPNSGGPTVGKAGGSGHGEAVSNGRSPNGDSPTTEVAKGVKFPGVGNKLGNGASLTSNNVRSIGNIVGVSGTGNSKPASMRAMPSDSQSPVTNRGATTPRNSGEFSITGNGKGSTTSSPRNSGELSATGNGNIKASANSSPKVSGELSNTGIVGSSAPRAPGGGNFNGRIVTGTSPGLVGKGARLTADGPIGTNATPASVSNVGNLLKGNWNGNVLTGAASSSNGSLGKSNGMIGKNNGKVDLASGNILSGGNLSHGAFGTNGLASKVMEKDDAPKSLVDGFGVENLDCGSESLLMKRALCSKYPEDVKNAGNELYKKGLFSDALLLYERAITLCPGHASYRSNRAAALSGLGRLAEAVQECEEAIKLDPFHARAHHRAASLYLRLGLLESSKRHFRAAGQQSDWRDFQCVEDVTQHISRCIEMRRAANWKSVIRESDAAVVAGADSAPQVLGYKAEALLRLHRTNEADVILSTAQKVESSLTKLGITPVDSFLFAIRAQIDMALGRFEEGVMASESAARADPRNMEVSTLLRKARAVYRARNSGNELFKAGKLFEACAAYGEGLESDPTNSVLLCNRAACRSKLGQWEKAIEDCNAALDVQPKYTKALMRRANCNAKLERWEDALNDYEALIKEVPGDMDVARGLFEVQVAIRKSRGEEIYKMKFGGDVEEVSNNDQLQGAVSFPGLVVVQFLTRCNEQCKQISPFMKDMCKRYPSVNFIKVDVEENPYLAKTESVNIVPTFKLYKNGMKIKEILAPSQQALEHAVQHYSL